MKPSLLIISMLLFSASSGFAEINHSFSDSLLYNIQQKIDNALSSSIQSRNMEKLKTIEKKLDAIDKNSRIVQYWKAYTLYNVAIYGMTTGNKKAGSQALNKGLQILQNINTKGSDDYALLAQMQGVDIAYKGGSGAAVLGMKAIQNAHKAVNLDRNNVRAWYVLGSMEFHTPKHFGGGGKKVEKDLKKAINLKEENSNNPYLPTWVKQQAYVLLVTFYSKNKQMKKAKKALKTALKKYPHNYRLMQFEKQMGGK
jgi:tetratricopeptide (TPR) repeat protein